MLYGHFQAIAAAAPVRTFIRGLLSERSAGMAPILPRSRKAASLAQELAMIVAEQEYAARSAELMALPSPMKLDKDQHHRE